MTGTAAEIVERIWARDPTLWTGADEAQWLGWLDEPWRMREDIDLLLQFAESVVDRIDAVVLLGMGGSSLAPEVIQQTFRQETFNVLDTTHPQAIRELEARLDLQRTLFISSSKSGSTLETRSHTDYFWEKTKDGQQWVAVTDPGSELEQLAREREFSRHVRGRADDRRPVLGAVAVRRRAGVADGRRPDAAARPRRRDGRRVPPGRGQPRPRARALARRGLARRARQGLRQPEPGDFGLWVEQLLAESTGKQGKGLIPAPGEPADGPDRQAQEVRVTGPYELGQEFFRWEFATAVAGSILGINPFDQPDVQAAKDKTKEVLASGGEPDVSPQGSAEELFAQAKPGDYVCIQAFVDPTDEAAQKVLALADRARQATGCVVTHGFGPRYLHSTGQLHKGGPPTGLFLQVVDDTGEELAIPGQPFGFGKLIRAQAAGDFASLEERGRRVARIRLEDV